MACALLSSPLILSNATTIMHIQYADDVHVYIKKQQMFKWHFKIATNCNNNKKALFNQVSVTRIWDSHTGFTWRLFLLETHTHTQLHNTRIKQNAT